MAWFKVDDKLTSHRKFLRLGRIYGIEARALAMGLWVQAGTWSALNETNGFIPEDITEEFIDVPPASAVTDPDTLDVREALCDVGFWSRTDDGYQFEGWAEYQPTKEGADEQRAKDAERKRRSRARKKGVTPASAVTDSDASAVTARPSPPSRPDPSRPDPSSSSSAEPPREDVEALCTRLRDHVARNTDKPPTISARWRTEARLLLDKDGIEFDEAARVLDWCQQDSFWMPNILSMPKFREKFAQLQIKSRQSPERGNTNDGWSTPKGYDPADWLRKPNEPSFDYIDAEVVQLREIGR